MPCSTLGWHLKVAWIPGGRVLVIGAALVRESFA
jgi:hypothetical protein